jgi:UDP-N-acetylglucosamine 4,6-dehydratase
VVGSRGSVIPIFMRQKENGKLSITDERMTRFWIFLEQGVRFVLQCIDVMQGGEVFVPKLPSTTVVELAKAIAPEAALEFVGIRPGEKLHEVLISQDEARTTVELEDMYVIQPSQGPWYVRSWENKGKALPGDFRYASNENANTLRGEDLSQFVSAFKMEEGQS